MEQPVTLLPERIIDSQTLYEGSVVKFYVNTVVLPNGNTAKREIVGTRGAVAIVPLTGDGHVQLVRQYRSGISDFLLEIPAGTLEPGESPDEAAPRELAEETGYRAESWRYLTGIYTTPGICDEVIHIYLAAGLTGGSNHLDPDEFIDVVTLPLAEAVALVFSGDIRDAKTIAGLLLAAQANDK
jgi:ADP-ribose pyrophosphatase